MPFSYSSFVASLRGLRRNLTWSEPGLLSKHGLTHFGSPVFTLNTCWWPSSNKKQGLHIVCPPSQFLLSHKDF